MQLQLGSGEITSVMFLSGQLRTCCKNWHKKVTRYTLSIYKNKVLSPIIIMSISLTGCTGLVTYQHTMYGTNQERIK